MADDRLTEAALDAEAARDVDVEWVRHEVPPKNPSAVYSVRIPADRIEQLRRVAAERGVQPTALIRSWVLAQLDAAEQGDDRRRVWEREVRETAAHLRDLLSDGPLADTA
ncbi:hypothetical protein [Kutzneria kofuensis]|uniref:Uncharacterized protein n=1 Tax=Kutzneria kofuensis TaxID=103725 RepID=A0A7W9KG04_9PSEU|nr:hypothetical protein [Kutzneria kofuensis]MBB5891139.1 hypothetical protein [Kutzneria kofuensis]